jgi:hypothetical protein
MTSEEYIERVLAIGYDVHLNDGVWWIKTFPFFYEPAIPYQALNRGESKPKIHKALFGYRYIVSNEKEANKYRSILLLNEERLRNFGMQSLSSSKRAQVRKGLRLTEIRKIETIEAVLDDMKDICISQAMRTGHGEPPKYYIRHYEEWRASLIKQFNIYKTEKESWGAFYRGSLIAFINIFQVDGTMMISNVSSHTDHLDKCPNDALLFTILDDCRNRQDCKKVSYGDWSLDRPSLNEFKQKYGFERVDLPMYAEYNPIVVFLKKLISSNSCKRK